MSRTRGFEVLPEFLEKIKMIIMNDPEVYGLGSADADYLKNCYDYDGEEWLPSRATAKSAGYDIRSVEDVTINPGEIKLVGTGLTAYMMDDEELQIRPRSGNALKKGISVLNAPGTVDSDYYGKHIGVIMINHSKVAVEIKAGDRIAQGVFKKYLIVDNDNPAEKERTGGFGSTGGK